MIDNPAPTVPSLGPDNAVDVVKLGSSKLLTYIKYPGIETGDDHLLYLNFRGCAADGTVVDELIDQVAVDTSKLTPYGMPAEIENHTIVALDMGWAFYSYRVSIAGGAPGDESRRIFFYVGKRPRARPALPVLQIQESHDLHLDLGSAPAALAVRLVPYEAMSVADIVTLHCRRFYADGQEYLPPLAYPTTVTSANLDKPLALFLSKSDLRRVDGGWIELNYGIQYAGTTTEKTLSATQTIELNPPTTALLPALTIVGHSGGPINPVQYPAGLPLRVDAWPDISVGDELLCYVRSNLDEVVPLVLQARVDVSTIDKGYIELVVPPEWVTANNGSPIELQHQFGWIGSALSAIPYPATIRAPLNLPMAIVVGARPGDEPVEGEGEIDADVVAVSGINIQLDDEASYGPNDKVEVFFEGFGTTGVHSVTVPITPGGRIFNIPSQYIPANMGKSVNVYYKVTPQGETFAYPSQAYVLRVLPVPLNRYLAIQSLQAQGTGGRISIAAVPAQGEKFSFSRGWTYIRAGQTLHAVLVGKDTAGAALTYPIFNNHVVTPAQADAKLVESFVSKTELQKFQTGPVTVEVTIIYEPGAETKLVDARFTLVA
ncbi:hypothetical protein [Pseudomonas sp. NFX98]|uniref:hypothetical protein n=1 Tax=Pseudomonas sp. NFX98 TaxID=3399122 RepID=UPI0039FBE5D5